MNTVFGIGHYLKEDYEEILNLSEDRENMDETWLEWKKSKATAIKNFKNMGIKPIDVIVIPKELVKYYRENGLNINGKSRANFISFKVSKLNKK